MPEPKQGTSSIGLPMHYSAGAVIQDDHGRYLLIDRVKPPFGWAGPAGHVDEGEDALTAVQREVLEETGLTVVESELLFAEEIVGNYCRRGTTIHHWSLYRCRVTGELKTKPDEVKSFRWISAEELTTLQLEPVWMYWFDKLGICNVDQCEGENILRCAECSAPIVDGFCPRCGFAPSAQDMYIGIK